MTAVSTRLTLPVATATLLSGCLLAAGAGAGGGIYLTNQGVESVVPGGVEAVAAATERAFEHFDLTRTELRVETNSQMLRAEPSSGGDPEVTVTIRPEGERSSRVEVKARTSVLTWDKDYAREVIEKIVEYAH
jgi:hypothetical protein